MANLKHVFLLNFVTCHTAHTAHLPSQCSVSCEFVVTDQRHTLKLQYCKSWNINMLIRVFREMRNISS